MNEKSSGGRLVALDGLRGIAALGVALWHYQHFGGDPAAYPYRSIPPVEWMYARGWVLVDFFFLLSGCVFTFKYLEPVAAGRVSVRDFFVLRISRVYPLHVATLIVVAAIQWWRLWHHEPTLLYQNNDLYHFVLNLLFLHAGWFEAGFQYNNPSWSVGVEVFVYLVFFWLASQPRSRYVPGAIAFVLFSLGVFKLGWTYPLFNELIARAISGFFLGSLLFLVLRKVEAAGLSARVGAASLTTLGVIGVLAHFIGYDAFIGFNGFRIVPSHVLVLFPLVLVVALTVTPVARLLALRPLLFLGDISFTVYLVHVPLQMVMLLVYQARGTSPETSTRTFFWTFIVLLLAVSAAIHRFFEVPVRAWMRDRFLQPRQNAASLS